MHPLRLWAFILAVLWLLFYGVAFSLGFFSSSTPGQSYAYDILVLGGGPPCLLLCTLLAVRWERLAGSLLWVGSAAAALGLSLRSGPYLGRYFAGMALFVLPQVLVATLFLLHVRWEEKKRNGERENLKSHR